MNNTNYRKACVMSKELDRGAAILLPVSTLPSPYGIATLGKKAYEFVDMLKSSGQMYWQVLPVLPIITQDLLEIRILSIWILLLKRDFLKRRMSRTYSGEVIRNMLNMM